MSSVLEELDALIAKAAHGQVCNEESYPEDRAARALATLRADHLRPLVAGAEKHDCMHGCELCDALAALGRDIAKLKEAGRAR